MFKASFTHKPAGSVNLKQNGSSSAVDVSPIISNLMRHFDGCLGNNVAHSTRKVKVSYLLTTDEQAGFSSLGGGGWMKDRERAGERAGERRGRKVGDNTNPPTPTRL